MTEDYGPMDIMENLFTVRLATQTESAQAKEVIEATERWSEHWDAAAVWVLARKSDNEVVAFARHWTEQGPNGPERVLLSPTVCNELLGVPADLYLASKMIKTLSGRTENASQPTQNWWVDIEGVNGKKNHHEIAYYRQLGFEIAAKEELPEAFTQDRVTGLPDPSPAAVQIQVFMNCSRDMFIPFHPSPADVTHLSRVAQAGQRLSW